jgi:LDH2 family malate/lactate/ureidoglycolate dehydrogenase
MPTANPPAPGRYEAAILRRYAGTLLGAAGMPPDRAADVSAVLLEADLLGRTTHGLALLPAYLQAVVDDVIARVGEPLVIADQGSALTWDGGYLPGPWLVRQAIVAARARLSDHPLATVVIRRSAHIGCLQAYLREVADAGLVIVLSCSDPSVRTVAPHGATEACLSPNPLAAGIPTGGDPVLLDISLATTANGPCLRAATEGRLLPGPWLVDREGNATEDPRVLAEGRGALLPLGGLDLGYKGFGLLLLVEALTNALGGHGRADRETHWGASVFLLLIDPDRFGGSAAFEHEMRFIVESCRKASVPKGRPPTHIPGAEALKRRRDQLKHGVELHPSILPALAPWAARFGIPPP